MVGIFALLNGEPRSCFSMRCCDLLHNHSCQLAHYGFCPKPLSDVRRALFFPGCRLCLFPRARPGKNSTNANWDRRKPLAGLVIIAVNKDLTPLLIFFLFGSLISSSAVLEILRDNTGEMKVCPDAFSRMAKTREREKSRGREKEDKSTSALTNSSHNLHTEELH